MGGESIAGQRSSAKTWSVNGTTYPSTTTSTSSATGVDYVSTLTGIDVTVRSSIRVAKDGTVGFEVTAVEGGATVTTLGLPDNAFLSVSAADAGAALDRTVISPDSTKNADEHIAVNASTATGQKGRPSPSWATVRSSAVSSPTRRRRHPVAQPPGTRA